MVSRYFVLVVFFAFLSICVFGQTDTTSGVVETINSGLTAYDETKILYRQEKYGGILVHSYQGIGANYRDGKHLTALRRRLWSLEFVTMKHPKERKTSNPYFEGAKQFVYGKKNEFLILRPSYGFQQILTTKEIKRGVQISLVYLVGPSIGILKPVYLEIATPSVASYEKIISTEKYDENKHGLERIYGRASVLKGVNEIKLQPGIHTKFAFNFEFASNTEKIRALETGVNLDAFYKSVPIIAFAKNEQVYLTFYINLLLGNRTFY